MFFGPMENVPVNGTPQKCALIRINDNKVVNIIIADPIEDPAPEGHMLVGLTEDSSVHIDWVYNPADGTFTN